MLAAFVAVLAAGCSGSSGGSAPITTLPTTSGSLPTVPAGKGVIELSGDAQGFTVKSCVDGPAKGDTPEATQQFRLTGTGDDGTTAFTVSATRYVSTTKAASNTITETVQVLSGVGSKQLGIEAKRTSIKGTWLDLNQPGTSTPLIARAGKLVTVTARFGPEGSRAGDAGVVSGRMLARCPG